MQRRHLIQTAALSALALSMSLASAQDNKFKIGLILPMTGQSASTGRQIEAAARLYIAQNGDTVAGKKVELIVKDDTGLPDVTKRLALYHNVVARANKQAYLVWLLNLKNVWGMSKQLQWQPRQDGFMFDNTMRLSG